MTDDTLHSLFEQALAAAKHSYSPYSRFPVGAAVLTKDGDVITGTNIENRSFGLTNCAERSALFAALSQGHTYFLALAVATPAANYPVAPCGACRQVISEFCQPDMPVIFGPSYENTIQTNLAALYPFDSLHELAERSSADAEKKR